MESTTSPVIIGVRFSKVGKIYHFNGSHIPSVRVGDSIVVETSRGWQIGEVAQLVDRSSSQPEGGLKQVDRIATARDLLLRQVWQLREVDVVEACRKRATDIRIQNIKIIAAEYSFDGSRLTILYSSEAEEKVELKSLRQDMQKQFSPAVVEMRQIGPRDVAKLLGGMGACGLETRCCSMFLTEFSSISIRMAKEQGISLTPTEITGMCGRLRCCLIYEYDTYAEARKGLPKRNKRIATPEGEGRVIDVAALSGTIRVDIPDVGVREYTREQLAEFSAPPVDMMVEDGEDSSEGSGDASPPVQANPPVQQNKPRQPNRPGGGRSGRRYRGNKRN